MRADPTSSCRLPLARQSLSTGCRGNLKQQHGFCEKCFCWCCMGATGPSCAVIQVLFVSSWPILVPGGLSGQLL